MEIIFERFSQAEKDLNKNVGGLGLGLSIAKENAELIGGNISVKSEMHKGSVFTIYLPYQPAKLIVNTQDEPDRNKNTILVADDEGVNFMFLEILLNKLVPDYNIIHAKDGLEAIDICQKNESIILVLMDIKMPRMNGFEATKKIKEFRPELCVVAQTAYSTREDIEMAKEIGCSDYLSKPINKLRLKEILTKYLVPELNV